MNYWERDSEERPLLEGCSLSWRVLYRCMTYFCRCWGYECSLLRRLRRLLLLLLLPEGMCSWNMGTMRLLLPLTLPRPFGIIQYISAGPATRLWGRWEWPYLPTCNPLSLCSGVTSHGWMLIRWCHTPTTVATKPLPSRAGCWWDRGLLCRLGDTPPCTGGKEGFVVSINFAHRDSCR